MKNGNGFGRKLRYGSVSVGITALVIAAVILVNALVSVLCSDNRWFTDISGDSVYTLGDNAKSLLASTFDTVNATREEDDAVQVDIIFCNDPDMLYGQQWMRYIYYTALAMQKAFPHSIQVSTVDVWENPSAVDAYRTNAYSTIYQSDVIVASGSEFRVLSYKSFYTFDSDASNEEVYAYSGEKRFLSSIMAVTRAEAPICALTVNHGEPFATEEGRAQYSEFLNVIEKSGYDIQLIDLEMQEIPENCRLIITFDPQTDFASTFNGGTVSEVSKIRAYLDDAYSYMVFFDADTPKLPVLEEYLEEWGIAIGRYSDTDDAGVTVEGNLKLQDSENALDSTGSVMIGQYETEGVGASLTSNMRKINGGPKVVFGNAVPLLYSPTYQTVYRLADEENGTEAFIYGAYTKNSRGRDIFDVFRAGEMSVAYAQQDGEALLDENGEPIMQAYNSQSPYRLMTLTRESRVISEGKGYTTVNNTSYVCAVGSTDFVSNELLTSNAYGNTDALLGMLRYIGYEIVPVGITFKVLYKSEMNSNFYTATSNTVQTVVLVLLPAVILTTTGVFVLIRRKVRH